MCDIPEENLLNYVQLSSSINPSFWSKLTEIKLDIDKLNESKKAIWGYFFNLNSSDLPFLEVDSTSFNSEFDDQNRYIPFHGAIINKNTVEQFKEVDKNDLITLEGKDLINNIKNGRVLDNPSLLNIFFILSFADLKKYHYYYWFAFPVPSNVKLILNSKELISNVFSPEEIDGLYEQYSQLHFSQKAYFLYHKQKKTIILLKHLLSIPEEDDLNSFYFIFYNISFNSNIPGSQLRNFILVLLNFCKIRTDTHLDFIAFNLNRTNSKISCDKSTIYSLKIGEVIQDFNKIQWVGWEKNERGKMGPRMVNMKSSLDPLILAENAVDLNLKLMKWRLLPTIDLDRIKNTKCLLLGSGTLGCSVARTLLAWGVRTINFVDNSTVSFSNPVRQSLFTYQDSVDMKPKSKAASDNLKLILPSISSEGYQLNIPMPGHPVGDSLKATVEKDIHTLVDLISNHDVIFLLMDSRESRWLPTLLGQFYDKVVINAALGFDSYLVLRHGSKLKDGQFEAMKPHPEGIKSISGSNLGCYFCNDVTAPGNSMKDRTLDQQCTVTRPGVSQIAGALAVELAVSILQHDLGNNAPAFYSTTGNLDANDDCILGLLPHSIRGFLSSFNHVLPATQKYNKCIACSQIILKEYELKGMDFLFKVFNSSKYLEDITGLTEIFKETNFDDVLEFSDGEDF